MHPAVIATNQYVMFFYEVVVSDPLHLFSFAPLYLQVGHLHWCVAYALFEETL